MVQLLYISQCMSSPKLFSKVRKTLGAGFFLPGCGTSPLTGFFFHARCRRAWKKKEKGFFGGHPRAPGRRAAALLHHPRGKRSRSSASRSNAFQDTHPGCFQLTSSGEALIPLTICPDQAVDSPHRLTVAHPDRARPDPSLLVPCIS